MIKDILNEMRSAITIAYPNKFQLPYSTKLESNPSPYLKDGFCVSMLDGNLDEFNSTYHTSINRKINVVLTKGVSITDLQTSPRYDVEEILIDEMLAVIRLLKSSPNIREFIVDINYDSDSGIKELQAEKLIVLHTTISMQVRYKEYYN